MLDWFFDWPAWLQIVSAIVAAIVGLWGLIEALEGLGESYRNYSPRLRAIGVKRPIMSTLVVFIGAGTLAALGWRAFLHGRSGRAAETAQHNAQVEWREDGSGGLSIAVLNETTETLRDVWIKVLDMRMRSQGGDFAEVSALHGTGTFEAFSIGAGFLSDVYPDKPLVLPFLKYVKADPNRNNTDVIEIWRVVTRDSGEVLERLDVPSPGVWRVTLEGGQSVRLRVPYLYFKWERGTAPTAWSVQ
jgi:hypothetical protein